ncbi:MAG TPA: hypothetical protein VF767_03875 [Bryobacteraceae bacterium]
MSDPRSLYTQLLEKRRADIAAGERRHRKLGYYRLAAVSAIVALVLAALFGHAVLIVWALAPMAVFAALLVVHENLLRALEFKRRAERFFVNALARLDGNWAGTGETGEAWLDPEHPYAKDLDLFGRGSLFELLSTARTHIGEETLARWLLAPADPATILERQQAVDELRGRLDLREDLAVLAEEARSGHPGSLADWGEAPPRLQDRRFRVLTWAGTAAGLLAAAAGCALALRSAGLIAIPDAFSSLLRDMFVLILALNIWFLYRSRREMEPVISAVEHAANELRLLSEVLLRLEREKFHAPLPARLRASLDQEGEPPSRRLARLNRLVEDLDSRDNVFVRLLEPFLFWTPHLALRVEDWRRHSGPALRRWLTATGEFEALCSLASHAFEHPSDTFPEIARDEAVLEAEAIGHPLIPEARVVRNDVSVGGAGPRVLVVSGSNMSGKSTLLRTLGVNAVLAQAGATVRAKRLRLSPLAAGASIRVTDSLQGGVSRFYAEILRIRQIVDRTGGALPVLFLIDEFLHGTNSHDRRIGAEALVRGLIGRGAIGLITTHDLALAEIAGGPDGRAVNVHFEDRIEDGRILFDYRLRPGVVRKSNAIELMRSVGLEI